MLLIPSPSQLHTHFCSGGLYLRSCGVTLVRTPPYMAEFAPIELGWSAMKRAQYDIINRTDDGGAIRMKLLEWMHNYPETNCKAFMDHSKRVEEARQLVILPLFKTILEENC